jgi:hypothetical protein
MWTDVTKGRTERHDEAYSHVLQVCEHAKNDKIFGKYSLY